MQTIQINNHDTGHFYTLNTDASLNAAIRMAHEECKGTNLVAQIGKYIIHGDGMVLFCRHRRSVPRRQWKMERMLKD